MSRKWAMAAFFRLGRIRTLGTFFVFTIVNSFSSLAL